MIDSTSHARLADFGLAAIIDEVTFGSDVNARMRGTIRWMAPEMMDPERFGFTKESMKRLPSRNTDIYSLGMTILEVSTIPRAYASKYSTTLPVGHYGTSTFQLRRVQHEGFDHRPTREPTKPTAFGVLGSIVGTVRDYMARRARVSALQTPTNPHYHRPTEQGCSQVAKINLSATPGTDRYMYCIDERK